MRLVYFTGEMPNFGDDLNGALWPRLAPNLFDPTDRTGFLGIGTIIGMPTPGCDFLHVFSSGVGYDRLDRWEMPHRIWCVRGPLTARLLGCGVDRVATDGAILAPWTMHDDDINPASVATSPGAGIGVIPHWESLRFAGWPEACARAGFTLISPIDTPDNVIRALRNMRLVIAESLHGVILADSYGIPWVPFMTTRNFSVFKWMDWCLSMDVALSPVVIPPPSLAAALHFGRPPKGRWGSRVTFDAEEAIAEFNDRVRTAAAHPGAAHAAGSHRSRLRRHTVATLRRTLELGGPAGALASFASGCRPAHTAMHLVRASRLTPVLSRAALRDSLRDRMVGQFREVCRVEARECVA